MGWFPHDRNLRQKSVEGTKKKCSQPVIEILFMGFQLLFKNCPAKNDRFVS